MIIQLHDDLIPVPDIPEKNLWASVLLQAFKDLEGLSYGNRAYSNIAKSHAEGWVASNDISYIGSFLYVCEVLDYDPDWVRARFRQTKNKVKRKEKVSHGVTARIKAFDPAVLEQMTCLEIASHFGTSKSLVYNIVSNLGIKYKQIRPRSGNHRKKLLDM